MGKLVEVAQVEYLGLEVNSNSVEMFEAAIETRHATLNGKLNFQIHSRSAEHLPDVGDGFDLVLMSLAYKQLAIQESLYLLALQPSVQTKFGLF